MSPEELEGLRALLMRFRECYGEGLWGNAIGVLAEIDVVVAASRNARYEGFLDSAARLAHEGGLDMR